MTERERIMGYASTHLATIEWQLLEVAGLLVGNAEDKRREEAARLCRAIADRLSKPWQSPEDPK